VPMRLFDNDRWVGRVPLQRNGRTLYTIEGLARFVCDVAQRLPQEARRGAAARARADRGARAWSSVRRRARAGKTGRRCAPISSGSITAGSEEAARADILLSDALFELMARIGPRTNLTRYDKELTVVVDRLAARYGACYELFPRSMSDDPKRHGTFDDVIAHLPYIREMGFDVLYLPPIHPIAGPTARAATIPDAGPGRPGQPLCDRRARGRPCGDPPAARQLR